LTKWTSTGTIGNSLIFDNGTNVGIGTASPSALLDVNGNLNVSASGNIFTAATSGIFFSGYNSYAVGIFNDNSGVLRFQTGSTEKMRITSAGRLGIGTTNPRVAGGSYNGMEIYGANGASILLTNGGDNITFLYNSASGSDFLLENAGAQIFRAGSAERMRITSGGNLLINRTADSGQNAKIQINTNSTEGIYVEQISPGGYCYAGIATLNAGAYYFNVFKAGSTFVGQITSNGSTTTYATSSDYRIKEDLKETKGLEKVSAIKIYDFKYKDSNNRMDGVIAHELQDIIPYAVVGEKDGENMQGVDYSLIVPVLVKAIQEQQAQISAQSIEIDNLKKLIN
jgi:hypothetical protein